MIWIKKESRKFGGCNYGKQNHASNKGEREKLLLAKL